ncbi:MULTISPECIES: hypothetical protein [unclassified Flavobacterium]|uniref:hypothetical protein n=1 Tax=unclassified Flavobacterium TaxID=196869 RepID=UPI001F1352FD|nr:MULTISPECIES: hypothetical protein [unclassified Flavobacterium]UMY65761.1 hypothetical protein MKO97_14875 [Flavobacterium sp. HJ-32-4]
MITRRKLHLYQYFNADRSDWNLYATPAEKAGMTDGDWLLIERLMQELLLAERGKLDAEARATLEERLRRCCDGPETEAEARRVAFVNYN